MRTLASTWRRLRPLMTCWRQARRYSLPPDSEGDSALKSDKKFGLTKPELFKILFDPQSKLELWGGLQYARSMGVDHHMFTIHNLMAEEKSTCNSNGQNVFNIEELDKQIKDFLVHFWPSLKTFGDIRAYEAFWVHEYSSHGLKDTGMSMHEFFLVALVKLAPVAIHFDKIFKEEHEYTVKEVVDMIRKLIGCSPMIHGVTHDGFLCIDGQWWCQNPLTIQEIRIGWTSEFNMMDISRKYWGDIKSEDDVIVLPNVPLPPPSKRTIFIEEGPELQNRHRRYMTYILGGAKIGLERAQFSTKFCTFTILEAPGYKGYAPNLISQSHLADIGLMVFSAAFEESEFGWLSCVLSHVELGRRLGVRKILIALDHMDIERWCEARFDLLKSEISTILHSSGYDVKRDVHFFPISSTMELNLKTTVSKDICHWWMGPCLFQALNSIEVPPRTADGPLRVLITGKYEKKNVVVEGRVEGGILRFPKNEMSQLMAMPSKEIVKVVNIFSIDKAKNVSSARPGEKVRLTISGIKLWMIKSDYILCTDDPVECMPVVKEFVALLSIPELVDNRICKPGYKAILCRHTLHENCKIFDLMRLNLWTGELLEDMPPFIEKGASYRCHVKLEKWICLEKYSEHYQFGRLTLCNNEGKTVAVVKVIDLLMEETASKT